MSPAQKFSPTVSTIRTAAEREPAAQVQPPPEPALPVVAEPPQPSAELSAVPSGRPARARRPVRQTPVRITVDLAPELHSYLRDTAQSAGVVGADVIRELLRQMRSDEDLATRVETEIWRRREAVREAQRLAQE
jgi:hypothetical protein